MPFPKIKLVWVPMTACTITSHGFTKKFENFPTVADKH